MKTPHGQRWIVNSVFPVLLATAALSMLTGCAGDRRDPGYANKDGSTIGTRGDADGNYGSGNSQLDRQADDNRLNLYKNKTTF